MDGSDQEGAARTDLTRYLERLAHVTPEVAYDRIVGYAFARRYVGGKIVADIGWEDVGYGSQLLAETAESVAGLTNSTEAVDLARTVYLAPNAEYRKVNLPKVPYPEGYFDVVVAFGVVENLEQPEDIVREARRILKQDGVLIISTPDRRALVNGHEDLYRQRGMYTLEFRELLERHFGSVRVYRQGAVAGGFVFPEDGEITSSMVGSASLSLIAPHVGAEPPTTRSIIAVCGGTEVLEPQEPYLLLDHDRRVFDEYGDCSEDAELLRDEIRRMQETEVQAFQDSLKLHRTEIAYLRARIRRSDTQIQSLRNQIQSLRTQIRDMENSTTWRLFGPYRQLRARIDGMRKRSPESAEGSGDHRSR